MEVQSVEASHAGRNGRIKGKGKASPHNATAFPVPTASKKRKNRQEEGAEGAGGEDDAATGSEDDKDDDEEEEEDDDDLRIENEEKTIKIKGPALTPASLEASLHGSALDNLRLSLSNFRSQSRLLPQEDLALWLPSAGTVPSPSDSRIKLITGYLERVGADEKAGIKQILDIWDLSSKVSRFSSLVADYKHAC